MREGEKEKTVHLLEEISANFSAIDDEEVFEGLCGQILGLLERIEVEENDALILRDISHSLCGKIMLSKNPKLKPNQLKLYQFLKQKKLISALFERQIDEQFDVNPESVAVQKKTLRSHRMTIIEPANCASQIITNLKQLITFTPKASGMDKNLGFALLDLEGNFLLLCKKSRHLFGIKNTEMKVWNFFDLLIPYSKQLLARKFGCEMFHEDRLTNSTRCFNYVIYSKTAMKKFYTTIKRKKIETLEQFEDKLDILYQSANGRNLYNAYMTALTSCATIVTIRYTKAELNELNEQKMLFRKNQVLFEKDLIDKKVESTGNKGSTPTSKNKLVVSEERENTINGISLGDTAEPGNDDPNGGALNVVYVKTVILLKTRFSKNVPNFNYQKLRDEPSVLAFENYLKTKILGQEAAQLHSGSAPGNEATPLRKAESKQTIVESLVAKDGISDESEEDEESTDPKPKIEDFKPALSAEAKMEIENDEVSKTEEVAKQEEEQPNLKLNTI